jgi:hypothetical protein
MFNDVELDDVNWHSVYGRGAWCTPGTRNVTRYEAKHAIAHLVGMHVGRLLASKIA